MAGYAGLLLATPTVLYEVVAYVLPGLTRSERRLLAPIIFGSSILFYLGCAPLRLSGLKVVPCCRRYLCAPQQATPFMQEGPASGFPARPIVA